MSILENEAIKYAEGDYLKGVASVERTPSHEIINAFPGFIKTKLKYAFIAGAYYRDALLAEDRKFDRQKETKTCDNCKHSDLPGGYEPCVYCRNKDDWEPKENPCPCADGIDSKACVGCDKFKKSIVVFKQEKRELLGIIQCKDNVIKDLEWQLQEVAKDNDNYQAENKELEKENAELKKRNGELAGQKASLERWFGEAKSIIREYVDYPTSNDELWKLHEKAEAFLEE